MALRGDTQKMVKRTEAWGEGAVITSKASEEQEGSGKETDRKSQEVRGRCISHKKLKSARRTWQSSVAKSAATLKGMKPGRCS